jgi:glycine cleavage system H protein
MGGKVMKEINELILPDDLRYAEDHEWVRSEKANVRIGIDDYAQDQLGDIVTWNCPQSGTRLRKVKSSVRWNQ